MMPAAHAMLDMAAISHNFARVRERAPRSKIMAVIKANAYGHGLIRYARALADADAFAVARVDEGVVLREAGVRQRIAVLQGFIRREELELHARYDLEPVIHSDLQVELLESITLGRPVSVWLKLDSGMHRLGLSEEEFEPCHRRLSRCRSVKQPIALMTHLANADVLSDPVTGRQLDLFQSAVESLSGERSIANSAGLLAWENAQTEWVRPGIALYGVSPFPHRTAAEDGLKPVMTLRTRLIAIKHLKAGDAIGYGGDWICPHSTRLGIAAIGYGDGYPRHARSGTPVLVRERRVPLIGRVSMDMITLDLTDCPQAEVGDSVTLWGEGLPVEEIARHASTIPYALLCGVMPRVKIIES
jgi:alanine racemase